MIDVSDPRRPRDNVCVFEDGYTHVAQSIIYHGPQRDYQGREVRFKLNEDSLTLVNITNRALPRQL